MLALVSRAIMQQCIIDNSVNCWEIQNGQSAAKPSRREGSTTIPKGSTAKWLEAQSIFWCGRTR